MSAGHSRARERNFEEKRGCYHRDSAPRSATQQILEYGPALPMKRLTERSDWDYRYLAGNAAEAQIPGSRERRFLRSYVGTRYWSLIKSFIPQAKGQSILEIGCAPGRTLRDFESRFGCIPFGVEYSEPGIERTRENFKHWGYPLENIIQADVFDPGFQESVAEKFDVVVSGGFIEHFTDMDPVIDAHVGPLRRGGLLIVTIPNYRRLNYLIGCLTIKKDYPLHNLEIMDLKRFRGIFAGSGLQTLSCGYFGGFDTAIFDNGAETPLIKTYRYIQALLNVGFHIVPPPELSWVSPYLIFIGRKSST